VTQVAGQVGDLEMTLKAGSAVALTSALRYGSIDYGLSTDVIRLVFYYFLLEHFESVSPAHFFLVSLDCYYLILIVLTEAPLLLVRTAFFGTPNSVSNKANF
jgi:hypothetical protein